MDNNQDKNNSNSIETSTVQYKTVEPQCLNYNAQHKTATNNTFPTFKPEEKKPSNIILPNSDKRNNKE